MTPTLDTLRAELQIEISAARSYARITHGNAEGLVSICTSMLSALLAHIDALEVDARRYRWLKNNGAITFREPRWFNTVEGHRIQSTYPTSLEVDGAIDTALAEQREPK